MLAAAAGVISFRDTYYGYTVKIDHGNGYTKLYGHLTEGSCSLNVGDSVTAGQQIALSGMSGTAACHLHFGVYHNGQPTDPFGWCTSWTDPLPEKAVCLWGDGQCSEIVVEDRSAWFYEFGSGWSWDCVGNGWTYRYLSNKRSSETAHAEYSPYIPNTGPYAVYAFVPYGHATTTGAVYHIHLDGSEQSVAVNQYSYSDQWVYLGAFSFRQGNLDYVSLDNLTGETDGSKEVGFDSIRFQQFRTHLPLVLKNYP